MSNSQSPGAAGVRYPNKFDIARLVAVGTPPYLEVTEAQQRYAAGNSLHVVPEGEPPAWFLLVAPDHHRFSVTFYAPTGTPLRDATWERDGDGLLCRRLIDLFYPDGDPGRRVPFSQVFSVTHEIGADGIVRSVLSSPIEHDTVVEGSVDLAQVRTALPPFGEWDGVVAPAAPGQSERFGLDAIDAALAAVEAYASGEVPTDGGWRIAGGSCDIMDAVDLLVAGGSPVTAVPVIERGAAQIIPLAVQAPPSSGRDPREERRRITALHDDVRDACEHREGQAISLDLAATGTDAAAVYAHALRGAGATAAEYWAFGGRHALVLVTTGDAADGDLSLSLQVVPPAWAGIGGAAAPAADDLRWSISDIGTDPAGYA